MVKRLFNKNKLLNVPLGPWFPTSPPRHNLFRQRFLEFRESTFEKYEQALSQIEF